MIISRVPFRMLEAHGVPRADVRALEKRFGSLVPGHIASVDDVIGWAIAMLPWPWTCEALRTWVVRGQERGGIAANARSRDALSVLVATPDHDTTLRALDGVYEELLAQARMQDLPVTPNPHDEGLPCAYRAWVASYCAAGAAHAVVCDDPTHEPDEQHRLSACRSALNWVISIWPAEERRAQLDACLQGLVSDVATYVWSWAKGGDA